MIDPEMRSSLFATPRDLFRLAPVSGTGSAAVCIAIYLGVVVGFGAVMAALVRAAGG